MAFPGGVCRVVFGGTLPGGEVWSTGFYAAPPGNGTTAQARADALVGSAAFTSMLNAWKPLCHVATAMTQATVYVYPTGSSVATDIGRATVSNGAGTATYVHPNQTAFCTTLRSANSTKRGRGRMFWPATGVEVVAASGLANQTPLAAFVSALAFLAGNQDAKVVSTVGGSVEDVVRIDADAVLDQQTNRRDRLRPARFGTAVT